MNSLEPRLIDINHEEFDRLPVPRQIIAHEYPLRFAVLDLGEKFGRYGINWNSQWIEPHAKISEDHAIFWLGVEQKVTAICLETGRILLSLPFTSPLIQIIPRNNLTALLTEQEIFIFNPRGSIRFTRALPEIAIGLTSVGDDFLIQFTDGQALLLKSDTGQFLPDHRERESKLLNV